MRVLERQSTDPADAAHASAFQVRLAPVARFVSALNLSMDASVSLLAVRDGAKFDFVLKDDNGKVAGVARPIVSSNAVRGIHLQATRPPHISGEFSLDDAGIASAAEMMSSVLGQRTSVPGLSR